MQTGAKNDALRQKVREALDAPLRDIYLIVALNISTAAQLRCSEDYKLAGCNMLNPEYSRRWVKRRRTPAMDLGMSIDGAKQVARSYDSSSITDLIVNVRE